VVPAPGEDAYRGSTRNGVQSGGYDEPWEESIRFEGTAAAAPAVPVQAPVAHTLRTLGQVQLYIQFRTNSAELDPAALPMLEELRDALRTDPGLRLAITGHTDNVGGAPANRPLSQRRAEAVRAWLAAQGVEAGRLRAEGRGQDQPVAENTTEAGRALNRRVQVTRVN
jgi:outer membrane protein OmpA-like peptidoglycan-associated protein